MDITTWLSSITKILDRDSAHAASHPRKRTLYANSVAPIAALLLWALAPVAVHAQSLTSTFTDGYTFTGTGGTPTLEAIYVINSDGTIGVSPPNCWGGCGQYSIGDWLAPNSGTSNFEVMATNGGCPYPLGTFGVWNTAGVGTGWGVYIYEINQSAVCTINVSIRAKSNPSVILGTAAVNFNVWTGT